MHKILAVAAALGLALPAAPALAEYQSIAVSYGDLDLASPQGQKRLDRRIESAARKVCGYYGRTNASTLESTKARACYKQARAGALTQFAAVVEQRAKGG